MRFRLPGAGTQTKPDLAAYGTSTVVFLLLYAGLRLICWWGRTRWPQSWSNWLEDALVMYGAFALTRRFYHWLRMDTNLD